MGIDVVSIMITIVLIVIEAIFSSGIAALENISEADLKKSSEQGDKKAKKLLDIIVLLELYPTFVLLVMTSINIAIGFCYAKRIVYWSSVLAWKIGAEQFFYLFKLGFEFIGIVLLIYIVVLLGNVLPQKMALKHSKNKAYRSVGLIVFFIKVYKVLLGLIEKSVFLIFKLTGKNMDEYKDNVTVEEFISIVNEGLEQGILENNEVTMIANIIEMDEKEVRDIMTRRQKIIALDGNITVKEAVDFMMEKPFSRFPVYDGDIDNIIGIVFWKDITRYCIQNKDTTILLRKLAKKPYMVPDTQKIDLLFEEMQLKKVHMAIAIDEYGQTAGIVAMEDVLEEIVGNIFDESDSDERMIVKQREGKYFMRGLTQLDDVARELGINMEKEQEDYDTLNGFLISQLGHIPHEKEKVEIVYKGYEFHVVDVKDKMIRLVRVHKDNK